MSRLVTLEEGRTTQLVPAPTPTVTSSNRLMTPLADRPIKVFMVSPCVFLGCPRERRQVGRTAPVVLPTRQAVVEVVADLAFEVRMPLVDVEHGVPPCR